jgi:ADP-heptose:LPS heptosyltransferase
LATVRERLRSASVEKFVVLNPGAGWETKRWPSPSFGEVAGWLASIGFSAILIGGGSDADRATAEEVSHASISNAYPSKAVAKSCAVFGESDRRVSDGLTSSPLEFTHPNPPSPFDFAQGLRREGVEVKGNAGAPRLLKGLASISPNTLPLVWTGTTTVGELIALLSLASAHIGGDTGSTHIAAALGVPCVGLYSITNPRRSCPYGQIDSCLHDPVSLKNITVEQVISKLGGVLG